MKVTRIKNGVEEVLWHIQNKNICSDGTPYDMFIWHETEPTEKELRELFADDYGCELDDPMADEFVTSSEIYTLYVSGEE